MWRIIILAGRGVEDSIGVVAERDNPDDGPLFKHAATGRELRNKLDDRPNSMLDGGGGIWIPLSEVISNFREGRLRPAGCMRSSLAEAREGIVHLGWGRPLAPCHLLKCLVDRAEFIFRGAVGSRAETIER